MLFLQAAKLVILSQPKTGSVALDLALRYRADWVITRPDKLKHMRYEYFLERMAPILEETGNLSRADYRVISIMRDPVDWMGSLYRYNSRETWANAAARAANYTGDMTFDTFVLNACNRVSAPPNSGKKGGPCGVALAADGTVGVDLLYPYEDLSGLYQLLEARTGSPVTTERRNVSPERPLTLSAEVRQLFLEKYAFEADLHATLRSDGVIDARFRTLPALRKAS